MADEATVKRDQEVLNHLIGVYVPTLGIFGLLPTTQAQRLRRLSLQVGAKVAKGTIEQMRKGQGHKGERQLETYEGLTLVFAAADERLIPEGVDRPNCFLLSLDQLRVLAGSYQPPVDSGKALQDGLERMRDLKVRLDSRADADDVTELERYSEARPAAPGGYASAIFNNWRKPARSGRTNIIPGFYQVFRLYKPPREISNLKGLLAANSRQHEGGRKPQEGQTPEQKLKQLGSPIGNYGGSDLGDHVVLCELAYVDPAAMECVMVTCERDKFIGTIYINHQDIIFGILQRKEPESADVYQRFLCMKLVHKDLIYHSGQMIKVGETTGRPLASECLFVRISPRREEHRDLYQELDALRKDAGDGKSVARESVIARYLTPAPPRRGHYDPAAPAWKNVKFVRDFPALLNLSKMQGEGVNRYRLLREPSRTIDQQVLDILGEFDEMALRPYRREEA
jgi:hypothetical protein